MEEQKEELADEQKHQHLAFRFFAHKRDYQQRHRERRQNDCEFIRRAEEAERARYLLVDRELV